MGIDILSLYLIERYWRREQFGQLLTGLSQNGLWLPDRLAVLLAQSQVGAVSLGLKRVLEMSYGLTLLGREMANQLVVRQAVDGSFNSDPLVTGMASSSLGMALGSMQGAGKLFVGGNHCAVEERALVAAYICWLLARDLTFYEAVRFDHLSAWFETHQDQLGVTTARLWRMAQLGPALVLVAAQGACGRDVVKTCSMVSHVPRVS